MELSVFLTKKSRKLDPKCSRLWRRQRALTAPCHGPFGTKPLWALPYRTRLVLYRQPPLPWACCELALPSVFPSCPCHGHLHSPHAMGMSPSPHDKALSTAPLPWGSPTGPCHRTAGNPHGMAPVEAPLSSASPQLPYHRPFHRPHTKGPTELPMPSRCREVPMAWEPDRMSCARMAVSQDAF